ncbi:hypothetical protein, partial [Sporomusa acidovorans]|uniref:hypothetical protein n=1 Tax=Sporomusa acidovorans TaxID=112900 RepID=UPI001C40B7EA
MSSGEQTTTWIILPIKSESRDGSLTHYLFQYKIASALLGASFGLGTGSFGGFNGGVGANKSKENEDS